LSDLIVGPEGFDFLPSSIQTESQRDRESGGVCTSLALPNSDLEGEFEIDFYDICVKKGELL